MSGKLRRLPKHILKIPNSFRKHRGYLNVELHWSICKYTGYYSLPIVQLLDSKALMC
jgi:hypothetical protein